MDSELETSFLRSAMTLHNPWMPLGDFTTWFSGRLRENHFQITQIPLDSLDGWYFEKETNNLAHHSGKFFRIEGVQVSCDKMPIQHWSEPLINQSEIGILGIITKVISGVRYFLMQAKMEPGNINTIQLSPSVQATKSNFTQTHKGRRPLFIEYFLDRNKSRVLIDQLQSEQGSRFIKKRNRNLIIEIEEDVKITPDFCWLTLAQIKVLSQKPNLINMNARSILASINYITPKISLELSEKQLPSYISSLDLNPGSLSDFGLSLLLSHSHKRNQILEIQSWLSDLKMHTEMDLKNIPLSAVQDWKKGEMTYAHYSDQYQSIVAVKVEASNREVGSWSQPLLKSSRSGINGLLCQRHSDGILYFLIQARFETGYVDLYELGPTVGCKQGKNSIFEQQNLAYEAYFHEPKFEQIRYHTRQSTEGGRFYHDENTYMIIELDPHEHIDLESKRYRWLTLGQILSLIPFGHFVNIELRELLACLNIVNSEKSVSLL